MIKIERVESLPIGGGYYVRIATEDGLVGVGQSGAWGYPSAVDQVMHSFAQYLVGQDPMRIEHHWQYLYRMAPFRGNVVSGALSAVDIALWDIKGQRLQAPIWELLGGRCRDRVRLHLLMEGGTPEEVYARAKSAVAEGFTALKFDPLPAGFQDMSQAGLVGAAVDRVAAAREAVGRDVDVIVELHRKLTPLQALPVCVALAQFQPLFVEDRSSLKRKSRADLRRRSATANGCPRSGNFANCWSPAAASTFGRTWGWPVGSATSRRSPRWPSRSMRRSSPTTSLVRY